MLMLVIFVDGVEHCSRKLFGEKFFNPWMPQILCPPYSSVTASLGQKYYTDTLCKFGVLGVKIEKENCVSQNIEIIYSINLAVTDYTKMIRKKMCLPKI